MMPGRRGFTLIELLVSLVLLGIVGAVTTRVLTGSQRLARFQSGQAMLQGNVRTGALLVPSELREVGITATTSDITSMTSSAITYRAMRSTGIACAATTTAIKLRKSVLFGYRDPVAGRDRALVFMESSPNSTSDDAWGDFAITGAPSATTCADGQPAISLPVNIDATSLAKIVTGLEAPVRTYEVMELALYDADGASWLGAHSVSAGEAMQPVLGPLRPSGGTSPGLELVYKTSANAVTGTATAVRVIEVTVRGLSDGRVSSGSGTLVIPEDSLVARVRLRNAPIP